MLTAHFTRRPSALYRDGTEIHEPMSHKQMCFRVLDMKEGIVYSRGWVMQLKRHTGHIMTFKMKMNTYRL